MTATTHDRTVIQQAIGYVARGLPLPVEIEDHLAKLGILDMILHPVPVDEIDWGDDE